MSVSANIHCCFCFHRTAETPERLDGPKTRTHPVSEGEQTQRAQFGWSLASTSCTGVSGCHYCVFVWAHSQVCEVQNSQSDVGGQHLAKGGAGKVRAHWLLLALLLPAGLNRRAKRQVAGPVRVESWSVSSVTNWMVCLVGVAAGPLGPILTVSILTFKNNCICLYTL